MQINHYISKPCIALAVVVALPVTAYAQDDAASRIKDLESKVQQLIEQRAQQDKQIELLTQELVGISKQMSQSKLDQSKIVNMAEKGANKGSPVHATFKDGLVFEDETGNWKLQLNGRVQADYRTYQPDDWKNDTFSIRRARLSGTFSFLKDFSVRVEGEYANDSTGAKSTTALTYGYLDFTRWPGAKIRAGQFKPFFGLERAQSTNFTDFTELSLATNNGAIFTSTYDRGIMLHGDPLSWLNYNAYVVNGSGQNNDDVRDSKDIGARINANLAHFTENKNLVLHVGASASKGSIGFSTATGNSITQGTEGGGVQFFNIASILGTSTTDKTRSGVEAVIAYGPVKLQSELLNANFEGTKGVNKFNHDIKTWYADLNWLITGEHYAESYKSGVFGRIKPKHNFDSEDGWGAFELGLRYSKFDASDFKSILTTPTKTTSYTTEANAWTAGAKWIFNPNARILLNYIHTHFDTNILVNGKLDDTEKALTVRAQYDF